MAKKLPQAKSRDAGRYKRRSVLANMGAREIEREPVDRPSSTGGIMEPRTEAQRVYINSIEVNSITFGVGPAGTGKTFIAAGCAAKAYLEGRVKKIIVTRPAVEAEEELGFLPGTVEDKFAPWFTPFRIELEKHLGKGAVECMIKNEHILVLPLAYMRGWTFDGAFVALDEAQNTTPNQMKLFLTRIGEDSIVVIDGDITQKDIKGKSGLEDAMSRLGNRASIACVEFTIDDIVRSGICRQICEAYAA
jgi:phosphate starvation-inducible protein PhoH and related proteins